MEYIIEFILELIFEFGFEASKSNKIPKFIRFTLIAIISLIFIFVIGLIIFMGISITQKNILGGLIIILFGLIMLVCSVIKFRKVYLTKNEQK